MQASDDYTIASGTVLVVRQLALEGLHDVQVDCGVGVAVEELLLEAGHLVPQRADLRHERGHGLLEQGLAGVLHRVADEGGEHRREEGADQRPQAGF